MFGLKNKVILVLGGRGYLGRDFCYYLKKQNVNLKQINKYFSSSDIEKIFFCYDSIVNKKRFANDYKM